MSGVRHIALFVGLATALAGCVSFQSRPLNAEKRAADFESRTLADAGLKKFMGTNTVTGTWNLEALTLAAFYFHPDLAAARAKWATATAGMITAGQRPNPTVSVSPAYNTTTAIPSPWIVTASLDVPIETAGKRRYRILQARHLTEAARHGIASTAWAVRTRLRLALLEVWAAQESATLLEQQFAAQEEITRMLDSQHAAGVATLAEAMRERIALEQTRLALLDARQRRTLARVQLAGALGLSVRALDGVTLSFVEFAKPPAELPAAEARQRALLSRADVLAALAEYGAGEAALRLEIAKQYPDVHLNPGYEFDQGDHKWGVGLSLELPLLNQNRGPIAEAEAHRQELAAQFNALQARVLGEIETAQAGCKTARQKLAAVATMLEQLDRQERLVRDQLAAGEVSRQAVAAARLERTTAALAVLDARLKAQQALGQLEGALQSPLELPAALFAPKPVRSAKTK